MDNCLYIVVLLTYGRNIVKCCHCRFLLSLILNWTKYFPCFLSVLLVPSRITNGYNFSFIQVFDGVGWRDITTLKKKRLLMTTAPAFWFILYCSVYKSQIPKGKYCNSSKEEFEQWSFWPSRFCFLHGSIKNASSLSFSVDGM